MMLTFWSASLLPYKTSIVLNKHKNVDYEITTRGLALYNFKINVVLNLNFSVLTIVKLMHELIQYIETNLNRINHSGRGIFLRKKWRHSKYLFKILISALRNNAN